MVAVKVTELAADLASYGGRDVQHAEKPTSAPRFPALMDAHRVRKPDTPQPSAVSNASHTSDYV